MNPFNLTRRHWWWEWQRAMIIGGDGILLWILMHMVAVVIVVVFAVSTAFLSCIALPLIFFNFLMSMIYFDNGYGSRSGRTDRIFKLYDTLRPGDARSALGDDFKQTVFQFDKNGLRLHEIEDHLKELVNKQNRLDYLTSGKPELLTDLQFKRSLLLEQIEQENNLAEHGIKSLE